MKCNRCGEEYVGLAQDCRCTNYGCIPIDPSLMPNIDHPRMSIGLMIIIAVLLILAALAASVRPAGAQDRPTPAGGIVWTGPRLAPAEAAAVMARAPGLANVGNWPAPMPEGGPAAVYVAGGRPEDGPFGAFPAYPVQRPLTGAGWHVTRFGHGPGLRQFSSPVFVPGISNIATSRGERTTKPGGSGR